VLAWVLTSRHGGVTVVNSAGEPIIAHGDVSCVPALGASGAWNAHNGIAGARVSIVAVHGVRNTLASLQLAFHGVANVGGTSLEGEGTVAREVASIDCARVAVVANYGPCLAGSVGYIAGQRRAEVAGETLFGQELASGVGAWGNTGVQSARIGIVASDVGGNTAYLRIAGRWMACIIGSASLRSEGTVVGSRRENNALVGGTFALVIAGNRGGLAFVCCGVANLGIARISPSAHCVGARNTIWSNRGKRARTSTHSAGVCCARIFVIASLIGFGAPSSLVAGGNLTFVVGGTWDGCESAISAGSGTWVFSTGIVVIAHFGSALASSRRLACVDCARNVVITICGGIKTLSSGVHARIDGALAVVVTHYIRMCAALHGVTSVNRTAVSIIAGNLGKHALSSNTGIGGAHGSVIAHHWCLFAASNLVACVNHAQVAFIAVHRGENALAVSERALISGARGVVIALDGSSGNTGSIFGSAHPWVALVTETRAIDFHRGSTLAAILDWSLLAVSSCLVTCTNDTRVTSRAIFKGAGTASGNIAGINGATVPIIAGYIGEHATSSSNASIRCASVLVIACDFLKHTTGGVAARIGGTFTLIVANYRSEYATLCGVTSINGAQAVIIASKFSVLATSLGQAWINRACVRIIADNCGVLASSCFVARIEGTVIIVVAVYWVVAAFGGVGANIVGTLVSVIAVYEGIGTCSTHALVICARSIVIAVHLLEAALPAGGIAGIDCAWVVVSAHHVGVGTSLTNIALHVLALLLLAIYRWAEATRDLVACIRRANIGIVAVHERVLASFDRVASVGCASVVVVAVNPFVSASTGRARIGGARVVIVAILCSVRTSSSPVTSCGEANAVGTLFGSVLASSSSNASVISASILIVTIHWGKFTSRRFVAGVCSAQTLIIAYFGFELASYFRIAGIVSTRIWIVTLQRIDFTLPSFRIARCEIACISFVTSDWSVHASIITGGDLNTASIDGAKIVIIAISVDKTLTTTRLSITLAHSAPVVVRTISYQGRWYLHIGLSGVSLAVEEVEFVAVARYNADLEGIQTDWLREFGMEGTQINDQTIIYVDPNIIITSKFEYLPSRVPKSEVCLETIPVIVSFSLTVGTVVSPTSVIKGEEGEVGIFVDSRPNIGEG
jgi:hypothetical protein